MSYNTNGNENAELSNTSAAQEPKEVICKIILKDDTAIEIFDQQVIDECKVLSNLVEAASESDLIPIKDFEPELVRFVFERIALYKATQKDFRKSEEFNFCVKNNTTDRLMELMEVANYLDCNSVLQCLGMAVAEKLKDYNGLQLTQFFGYEVNMTEAEQRRGREQVQWMIRRPTI